MAVSISGSADAWVVPAEIARLRPPGAPGTAQMLYRFDGAATAAAIGADVAAVTAALPARAVTGTRTYLTVKAADTARVAAYVPVLIACGLAGLVLALLTVAVVTIGAAAAGSARIRILKIIGFSPGQVAVAYAGQGLVPAAAGCLAGRPPGQPAGPAAAGRGLRTPSGPGCLACPPGWTSTWRWWCSA